jgi:galactonate dehydratase
MRQPVPPAAGYVKVPFAVENGYVRLPTGPGLGIELDDEALSRLDDPDWNFPTPFDADDGAVRDW